MLPTPSSTPVSVLSQSIASNTQCTSEQGTLPSYTPTNRRRCRTDDTLLDSSPHPARKRHRSSSHTGIGSPPHIDREGATPKLDFGALPQPEGDPPEPGLNPRNALPRRECPRGARRLRINGYAARGIQEDENEEQEREQVMEGEDGVYGEGGDDEHGEEGEYGDEGEVRDDGNVQSAGSVQVPRGSWRRRASDEPNISCSAKATTIIAELASAHCQSSIHDPLIWLQDIAGHLQTPYVEDESLVSVVARCRGIASKDTRTNFLVMVNYMALVSKCQRCVFPFLCLTPAELVCPTAYASRRVST
jgi:hypothetical protein